jgi:excisionase family DNA binding protein
MTNDTEKLTLSVTEAADRIGISAATLRLSIKRGQIPMLKLGRNKWRIPVSALERYLANAGAGTGAGM